VTNPVKDESRLNDGDDEIAVLCEKHHIIGRREELEGMLSCLRAGRHVLLEGPVGVGKTVLAKAGGEGLRRPIFRVDGDGRYTEQKLVGHFDPPGVLEKGYGPDTFFGGPLHEAMKHGGILFVNELNRMPEGVQNVLLPVMDEHLLQLPHLPPLRAAAGFGIVATMNPREFVATGHLSEALLDRFELITLTHQSEAEEIEIVETHAKVRGRVDPRLVEEAVQLVRRTRGHPNVARGASVRAAIAMVEIAMAMKGRNRLARAAKLALPTRMELKEPGMESLSALLSELIPEKKNESVPPRI